MREITESYDYLYVSMPILIFMSLFAATNEPLVSVCVAIAVGSIMTLTSWRKRRLSAVAAVGIGMASCAIGVAFIEGFVGQLAVFAMWLIYFIMVCFDYTRSE